jgi:hypothetical protein
MVQQEYLPAQVVDCTAGATLDLRYTYACTSRFRIETTILHLIYITAAVFGVAIIYGIIQKVVQKRRHAALLRAPTAAAETAASAAGEHADAAVASARAAAGAPREKLKK